LAGRDSVIEALLEALACGSGPDSKMALDVDDVDPVLATARAIMSHVNELIKVAEEKDRTINLRYTRSRSYSSICYNNGYFFFFLFIIHLKVDWLDAW
jgi:hypothetical protein